MAHQVQFDRPKPVPEAVRAKARAIVGDTWFRDSTPDRLAYGRDCWPLGIIWARGGKITRYSPDFIVVPKTVDEVVRLVGLARETGIPVIPYGAGSGVCGGTLAVQGGFIIDMKRLDQMKTLDAERLTVRAGAGYIGMHLETDLNRRGFTMGHFPSSLICSSLGGYLAGRSAGQFSSRFGKIEDMCLSLECVAGTGEVIETARWAPDLTQVIIGSEGTLGLITEATMRIEPVGAERTYRGFNFHNVETALDAIRRMIQAGYRPTVVRLYDAFDSFLANRKRTSREYAVDSDQGGESNRSLLSQLSGYAGSQLKDALEPTLKRVQVALLRQALGRPLLLNRAVSALPASCLLIVGFEGATGLTKAEADAAFLMLRRDGEDLGEEPGLHWLENRYSVSYKMSPMFDTGAFVDTMEVSTTWDNLHNLYRTARTALSKHVFVMAHFSHVYPEGSSIYFTFAGFAADGQPIEALYERTWSDAMMAVRQAKASIAHHHGVGLMKAPHLSHDYRGGAALNALVKARLDPDRIMNPGKLWDVRQVEGQS